MPYITNKERQGLADGCHGANAGQLNYLITILIHKYLNGHELNYQTINDIVGALEGAKVEFQRRIVAPYEDRKIKDNGDI